MQELGYRPNSAARALRSGHFRSIGVIMFTLSSYGNMRTLDAIAVSAATRRLLDHPRPRRATRPSRTSASPSPACSSRPSTASSSSSRRTSSTGRTSSCRPGLSVVVIDSTERSRLPAGRHRPGAGRAPRHRAPARPRPPTVWHIAGPADSYSATRREQSWRAALEENGRAVPEVMPRRLVDRRPATEHGLHDRRRIRRSRPSSPRTTRWRSACCAPCTRRGRRVPDDVSVVGFDDMAESDSFWPPLTTIHQEFEATGRRAVELLIAEIESRPEPVRSSVQPTRLVVRSSTAPPAARGDRRRSYRPPLRDRPRTLQTASIRGARVDGPGARKSPAIGGAFPTVSTSMRLSTQRSTQCARRDSNPQPSDP